MEGQNRENRPTKYLGFVLWSDGFVRSWICKAKIMFEYSGVFKRVQMDLFTLASQTGQRGM